MIPSPLHPTLWRTSRVLANRSRLRVLQLLSKQSSLTVSEVGRVLRLPRSTASEHLRALNARGLLTVQRDGRYVRYRLGATGDLTQTEPLLKAIQRTLKKERNPIERIFRLCTAFTHPRRLVIIRSVGATGIDLNELERKTRISRPALARHLAKLSQRGFLVIKGGRCLRCQPPGSLGRVLSHLAAAKP